MKHKRFVLDTNVWISYFITHKIPKLSEIIDRNKISIFSCDELIVELKRVLSYQHLTVYKIDIKAAVRIVLDLTVHFELRYPIKHYIPGDDDDNYLIALALQTGSGYIASGDKHILLQKEKLEKKYRSLNIIPLQLLRK
ncbi:MAG: putative toxin-antitoxin system toxin component, PIN family [Bacteroidetes bacterium]|nr:putative toxin-antitoxin system toxin component, PIN family [Bacteroidota bacterium]